MSQKIAICIIAIIAVIALGLSVGLVYKERRAKTSEPILLDRQVSKMTNESQMNQSGTASQAIQPGTTQSNKKPNISWERLIPDIKDELKRNAPQDFPVIGPRFGIIKEEDITGDGIPEAFIDIGTPGAYAASITLMIIEKNKPELAHFKDKDGKITPLVFVEGPPGIHGMLFGTIPEKRTIYQGRWMLKDAGGELDCDVSAYRWNSNLKIFEFNENLSMEVQQNFCTQVKSWIPF